MTGRPPWVRTAHSDRVAADRRIERLERRRYPSDWYAVGDDDGATTFETGVDNAHPDLAPLEYRDSGFASVDLQGVVTGPTPPFLVTVLPAWLPLPTKSLPFVGLTGIDWQLDPDGSLWVLG